MPFPRLEYRGAWTPSQLGRLARKYLLPFISIVARLRETRKRAHTWSINGTGGPIRDQNNIATQCGAVSPAKLIANLHPCLLIGSHPRGSMDAITTGAASPAISIAIMHPCLFVGSNPVGAWTPSQLGRLGRRYLSTIHSTLIFSPVSSVAAPVRGSTNAITNRSGIVLMAAMLSV